MSTLLAVNVNEHTEKKNGLTYLSWAWAWAEVLKIDPAATWHVNEYGPEGAKQPCCFLPDGSAMVKVTVFIKDQHKSCYLPVMDHRNKAIKNPDAFAVNTAIMRCMTKAISMHGLGLYIYAGEDLPEPAPETDEQRAEREAQARREHELKELGIFMNHAHENGRDLEAIRVWYAADTFSADNPTANEERKYVWGFLQSKLRSTIKANSPHEQKAA